MTVSTGIAYSIREVFLMLATMNEALLNDCFHGYRLLYQRSFFNARVTE